MSTRKVIALSLTSLVVLLATGLVLLLLHLDKLVPLACEKTLSLHCQAGSVRLTANQQTLSLHADAISIDYQGRTLLNSQSLAIAVNWRGFFDREVNIDYVSWRDLFVDTPALLSWQQGLAIESADPTQEPEEPINENTSVDKNQRWRVYLWNLDIANWRILLPLNGEAKTLQLDHFRSHRDLQKQERPLSLLGSFEQRPIAIEATMNLLLDTFQKHSPFAIDLKANLLGIKLNSQGELDFYNADSESYLSFDLEGSATQDIASLFGVKLPVYEEMSISGIIHERPGTIYDLESLRARLKTSNDLRINLDGSAKDLLGDVVPDISVSANVSSLQRLLNFFGIEMGIDLAIRADGKLAGNKGLIALEQLTAGVTLNGNTTHYGDQYTLKDSRVTLDIPLTQLITQEEFILPLVVEGGQLAANLDLAEEAYGFDIDINRLPISITSEGLKLSLEGGYKLSPLNVDFSLANNWQQMSASVQSNLINASSEADFSLNPMVFDNHLELAGQEELEKILRLPLPPIDTLKADARLLIGDKVQLARANATVTNHSLTVSLSSALDEKQNGQRAELQLTARRVSRLAESIQQLEFNITHAPEPKLLIATLATRSTIEKAEFPPVPTLDPAAWQKVLEKNPWTEAPISVSSKTHLLPGEVIVEQLELAMKGALVDFSIQGDAWLSKDKKSINLDIDSAFKAGAFSQLTEELSLRGNIATQTDAISSKGLTISYGEGYSSLDFTLDLGQTVPDLVASLEVDNLDLSPLIAQYQENQRIVNTASGVPTAKQDVELETQVASDGRVIPDMTLPTDWTRAATVAVDYQIKELNLGQLQIQNWQGELSLQPGYLNWPNNTLDLLGGSVDFSVQVDARDDIAFWKTRVYAERINPYKVMQTQLAKLDGPVATRINLSASGNDLRSALLTLDGRITVAMDDLTLSGANLNALAPNFIKSTLRILNPFSGNDEGPKKTYFDCGVFHAMVDEGVILADESILARTRETDLTASWQLNLKNEKQVIQAYPRQRATLTIPTGQLANAVEISGTLAKPRVGVNNRDLITGSAKTAFFFMGGWVYTMSKNEWEKMQEEDGDCALGRNYWLNNNLQQLRQPEEQIEEAPTNPEQSSESRRRNTSRRPR